MYALWRELARDQVAEAKARFEAPVAVPPTTIDVAGCRGDGRGRAAGGPGRTTRSIPRRVTDVVLAYDQNLTSQAAVLIESMRRPTPPVPCGCGSWAAA